MNQSKLAENGKFKSAYASHQIETGIVVLWKIVKYYHAGRGR